MTTNHTYPLLAYCPWIVGKDKSTITLDDGRTMQKWATYKNRFTNYSSLKVVEAEDGTIVRAPVSRDDLIDLIAVKGYATAYALKDDTLKKGRSLGANTLHACVFMLDFDNTWDIEDAKQHPWWDKVCFAYTTPSYGAEQGPLDENDLVKLPSHQYDAIAAQVGKPKRNFRLVFRFDHPIDVATLLKVARGFVQLFPMADTSCIDDARIFFGNKKARVEVPSGEPYHLNMDDITHLCTLGAQWQAEHPERERKRLAQIRTTNPTLHTTGSIAADTPIQLVDGSTTTVKEVLESRPLGWKMACFSPFRNEHEPSAFISRFADSGDVLVYDSGAGGIKQVFRACIEQPTTLQLIRKTPTEAPAAPAAPAPPALETLDREVITLVAITKPTKPYYEPTYQQPLTDAERRAKIKGVVSGLAAHNVFYAPEGFGKSFITIALQARMRKVLFACQTNEQAEIKAAEFKKGRVKGFPTLNAPKVQCVVSRDYLFEQATGHAVVRCEPIDPFAAPAPDRQATLDAIMAKDGITLKEAEALWETYHDGALVEKPDFNTYDIICTTMARAEILAHAGHYKAMGPEWVVIYDDPGFEQVCNLVPFTETREAAILKENERLEKEGKPPLNIIKKAINDRLYYVRPEEKRLGLGFKPITADEHHAARTIPVIYTTTEQMTTSLIQAMTKNVKVFDEMHEMEVLNFTLWGSKMTHADNDGLLTIVVELMKMEFVDEDFTLIGDGLGQALNHINNKGQNALSTRHIIIELSQLHPKKRAHLFDEICFIQNGANGWTERTVQALYMRDQLHQATGRNRGYRDRGSDYQTIAICDPHYYEDLASTSRYSPAPWSGQLDVGTGTSPRTAVRQRKRERCLIVYQDTAPPVVQRLQQLITQTGEIFDHPQLEVATARAMKTSTATKDRIKRALAKQIEKNVALNEKLSRLMTLS
jgi:hypothetical protein